MKISAFGQTDIGKKKENNEDAILQDDNARLYIVCDGVSTGNRSAVASKMACDIIREYLLENFQVITDYSLEPTAENRQKASAAVKLAIQSSCKAIYNKSRADRSMAGMCTTLVLALVCGKNAIIAHVGDSRIYLIRGGKKHLLTEDHTLAVQHVRTGYKTVEQARQSRDSATLTRALGFQRAVQIDVLNFELIDSDMLVMCSDGLSKYLLPGELEDTCKRIPAKNLPRGFIELANSRGGADNISAIVIEAKTEPADAPRDVMRMIKVLRSSPLFNQLNYRELLRVLNVTNIVVFPAGKPVIKQDTEGENMYISLSGMVDVRRHGQRLAELPAGSSFGEMSMAGQNVRSADVTTTEQVELMAIQRGELFGMIRGDAQLSVKFLWGLCMVLRERLFKTSEELTSAMSEGELRDMMEMALPIEFYAEEDDIDDEPPSQITDMSV